jgi:hypothetical protein
MFTIMTELLLALVLIASNPPHNFSIQDYFDRECNNGDQEACDRLQQLGESLVRQERLKMRSEEFDRNINGHVMLTDKKPDLQAMYPLVMKDYFTSEAGWGIKETLAEDRLPECARHYHNHWINKKLWWPTNDDGMPDWASIYIYIVDHYYGYCLRRL